MHSRSLWKTSYIFKRPAPTSRFYFAQKYCGVQPSQCKPWTHSQSYHHSLIAEQKANWLLISGPRFWATILTSKSPPHSCKQCKTSSWLVPPPLRTLEQAMFIKCSTEEWKKRHVQKQLKTTLTSYVWRLTALLVAEVRVVHRDPDHVGLVLVKLGGDLILHFWDFRLVLLSDINTTERKKISKTNRIYLWSKYQSTFEPVVLCASAVLTVLG